MRGKALPNKLKPKRLVTPLKVTQSNGSMITVQDQEKGTLITRNTSLFRKVEDPPLDTAQVNDSIQNSETQTTGQQQQQDVQPDETEIVTRKSSRVSKPVQRMNINPNSKIYY